MSPPTAALEFIAIYILVHLLKTKHGSRFVTVMTDCDNRLTRAVPYFKTSATNMAKLFIGYWIMSNRIATQLLTENRPQFVNNIFSVICGFSGTVKLTATAHDWQTNSLADRFCRTLETKLGHFGC